LERYSLFTTSAKPYTCGFAHHEDNWSLEELSSHEEWIEEEERQMFVQLWNCPTPSKVVALSWKALLNHIPTRVNLSRRNAIPPSTNLHCVFCNRVDESTTHLFVHCNETWKIWLQVQYWLGMWFITPPNLASH